MHSDELEKAFSDFIDGKDYDDVENALFQLIRKAFTAGWDAAKRDSLQVIKQEPDIDRPV